MRLVALSASLILAAGDVSAQTISVSVVDAGGQPVPFAVVNIAQGAALIADDGGRVRVRQQAADSLRVRARRIGYHEHFGWVRPDSTGDYRVSLGASAQVVATVTVTERANTPLAQRGFYDRVDRVRKGAIVAEFIPPEELDVRNEAKVSSLLQGRRGISVRRVAAVTSGPGGQPALSNRTQPVILGRGGCAMTIVIDGQVVMNSAQEIVQEEIPTSINSKGTRDRSIANMEKVVSPAPDIDELVGGREIMAIEIYPSSANAPAELMTHGGRGSCGMVVIWTGPRQ